MPIKNSRNRIHAQRMKTIRPYVDFDFDLRKELTPYQKRKIKTYFDEIDALTARPNYVYRPRSKEKLKAVQKAAQHEKKLSGLKVAFVPTNGRDKPKIKVTKKGKVSFETQHVKTQFITLDAKKLAQDPIAHVNDQIKKDPDADRFTIQAGRYEIPQSFSRGKIAEGVNKLTRKYAEPEANNYFGKWMQGLSTHQFKNQEDWDDYRRAKSQARRDLKDKRRNRKRRNDYSSKKG